jgi:hypothetical protein
LASGCGYCTAFLEFYKDKKTVAVAASVDFAENRFLRRSCCISLEDGPVETHAPSWKTLARLARTGPYPWFGGDLKMLAHAMHREKSKTGGIGQ